MLEQLPLEPISTEAIAGVAREGPSFMLRTCLGGAALGAVGLALGKLGAPVGYDIALVGGGVTLVSGMGLHVLGIEMPNMEDNPRVPGEQLPPQP